MHTPPLILVADDESDFREILSAKLTKRGFWVAEAENGDEVVERAKDLKPDLILLDINMPQANGTEALIALKNAPETKDAKVIFLTSLSRPWPMIVAENPKFAKELGAIDFIAKSEDLENVVKKVEEVLGMVPAPH